MKVKGMKESHRQHITHQLVCLLQVAIGTMLTAITEQRSDNEADQIEFDALASVVAQQICMVPGRDAGQELKRFAERVERFRLRYERENALIEAEEIALVHGNMSVQ